MRRFLIVCFWVGVIFLLFPVNIFAYYTGMPASVVVGQPDFTTNSGNQGGGTNATANTLSGVGRAIVIGGKMVISDGTNNRVLIYNQVPTSNNASADVVIGQVDFTHSSINQGGTANANTLSGPNDMTTDGTKLIIADGNNRRVLIFNTLPTVNNTNADVVIGQPDMITSTTGTTAAKFNTVNGVDYDPATGKLLITESSNNRSLIFNSIPTTNGASADVVIGQVDFTHGSANQGGTVNANTLNSPREGRISSGKLFISDFSNNRALIWNTIPTGNNASADVVIGQVDFTHSTANQGLSTGPNTINGANETLVSPNQRLIVGDNGSRRLLIFNSIPTTNNAAADAVIGEPDFTSNNSAVVISASLFSATGRSFIYGNKLLVRDNNRILIFYDATTTPSINLTSSPVSIGDGRYRLTGNVFMNKNADSYALQSLKADLNGVGYQDINFSGGRDDGGGNTIFDFTYDFDPTVGNGSITNLTIKFLASTYNADKNTLFYFLPFRFTSFNVSSTKSQSFTFSVNKDQLSRIKDNLDHFEVWYKKNTTTGTWTQYISNIPKTQINDQGVVVATKTTNPTKFIGSYIFKVQAIDNWGNRQDSNYLYTAGTIFPVRTTSFARNFLPLPTPTVTPIPSIVPTIPPTITPAPTPFSAPSETPNSSKLSTYLIPLGIIGILILIIIFALRRRRKKSTESQ